MTTLVEQREILALLDQNPAEGLRATAALIRERANKAHTGAGDHGAHWRPDLMWMSKRYEVVAVDEGTVIASGLDRWTADHVASLGPAVGLAMADLLEAAADEVDHRVERLGRRLDLTDGMTSTGSSLLALARVYLGGDV